MRGSGSRALGLRQAIALGLLHGPAELLPISSSGHVTVVPWLLGWDYPRLDEDARKAFEVALHAGTAAALPIALRGTLRGTRPELVALAAGPPALVGYALEGPIKRRLGTPPSVAGGLIAGALAMAIADRRPQIRRAGDARPADALWLGAAQACALVPGVSRNGATLAAARARGFTRRDAARLSWQVAVAPIAGATLLEAIRVRDRLGDLRAPFAAGATAAFLSTLASSRLARANPPLAQFALYRIALAAAVFTRAHTRPRATPPYRKIGSTR
jgi:undecaprenyl-diphosphatase